jgi:hypothetical protein
MSNATSVMPARPVVVLDWRHGRIGPYEPCVLCGHRTVCRSPVKDAPCHKACAETWITRHARGPADLARLIREQTPARGELR